MFRILSIGLVVIGGSFAAAVANEVPTIRLTGEIVDEHTQKPLAARVYVQGAGGSWHFVRSASPRGSAVIYDKTNARNPRSVEKHTTVSGHPFTVDLPPGRYTLTVERGKEYFPATAQVAIADQPATVRIALRRWVNMTERGWYSGETHIHRTLDELPNVVLAEDLNVAFPLTYWVTKAFSPPSAGDRNIAGTIPDQLIEVDATHVIWPRNTEYEIFTIGPKRHTLGALFVLGHRSVLGRGLPPVGPVAEQARREGALMDMDKLDWPFGLTLPHSSGATLYELANNHLWRTEFAFTDWNSEAPPFLQPPRGGKKGGERDWLNYTLGAYYALLNAGFKLSPSAGTANGVHPVPAGFSRVYVHLPDGFSYEKWREGLAAGRSFVTTGPMLLTMMEAADSPKLRIRGTVLSEQPLAFIEVVANGSVVRTIMPQNKATAAGARESTFTVDWTPDSSGWVCVRCFEDRPDGRVRFAHTAPWRVEVPGKPLLPTRQERDFLSRRVRDELERSKGLLPGEALAEYRAALERFEKLGVRADHQTAVRPIKESELRRWLGIMVRHGYSIDEISAATGLDRSDVRPTLQRWNIDPEARPAHKSDAPLLVLPYPGGRHPRIGFPDGAIDPQRETKVSVFTPWDADSYAVVDVPEAIWSNLGLTYLAHKHIPTIFDKQNIRLPPLEWTPTDNGTLTSERALPNGIVFGCRVVPDLNAVRMELWIRNGTQETLKDLRAQVCVMLKGMTGFHAQTVKNKITRGAVAACHDERGKRWLLTAWRPLSRNWNNPPVPCLHSDPSFPDCAPGQTVRAHGVLMFHEGDEIESAIRTIERHLQAWAGDAEKPVKDKR